MHQSGSGSETTLKELIAAIVSLEGFTDGIEGLLTTIRDNADQLEGYTDGLEGLITSTNSLITTLNTYTDGLEGLIGTTNASLSSIDSKETTGNNSLSSIDTKLTSQATAANQTSANTKLDTLHTDLTTVEGKQDTGNTSLSSIDTKLLADVVTATGTLLSPTLNVDLSVIGYCSVMIQVGDGQAGANPGGNTVFFYMSIDGINFSAIAGCDLLALDGQIPSFSATQRIFAFNVAGAKTFRASATTAQAISITMRATKNPSLSWQLMATTFTSTTVTSSALPALAATSTLQTTGNSSLSSIDTKLTSQATAARQDTGNTSLSSIDTKSTRGFTTASNTRPSMSNVSAAILASNASRKYAFIVNQGNLTVYMKFGATAVASQGIPIPAGSTFSIGADNLWQGAINGITTASTVTLDVFEGT